MKFSNTSLQTALDGFDNGRGKNLNLTAVYRRLYWHKEPGFIYLYEGVRSLLDALMASQIPMGLLTSKVREAKRLINYFVGQVVGSMNDIRPVRSVVEEMVQQYADAMERIDRWADG